MYKKLRYRKDEKRAMLMGGFPLCIAKVHCNSCITTYRNRCAFLLKHSIIKTCQKKLKKKK